MAICSMCSRLDLKKKKKKHTCYFFKCIFCIQYTAMDSTPLYSHYFSRHFSILLLYYNVSKCIKADPVFFLQQ